MSQKFQFSQIPYHQQPLSCMAHLTWLLRLNHECYSNVDSLLPIFSSFLSRVQKLKPCPQRGPQLVFAAQSTYFPPILTQFSVENKKYFILDRFWKSFLIAHHLPSSQKNKQTKKSTNHTNTHTKITPQHHHKHTHMHHSTKNTPPNNQSPSLLSSLLENSILEHHYKGPNKRLLFTFGKPVTPFWQNQAEVVKAALTQGIFYRRVTICNGNSFL